MNETIVTPLGTRSAPQSATAFQLMDDGKKARLQLKELRQTGGIRAYTQEFQRLTLSMPETSQMDLVVDFVYGLKRELREEVDRGNPETVLHAMKLADEADTRINGWHPRRHQDRPLQPAWQPACVPRTLKYGAGGGHCGEKELGATWTRRAWRWKAAQPAAAGAGAQGPLQCPLLQLQPAGAPGKGLQTAPPAGKRPGPGLKVPQPGRGKRRRLRRGRRRRKGQREVDRAGGQPKQNEKPPDTKLVNGPEREREMELKIMEVLSPTAGSSQPSSDAPPGGDSLDDGACGDECTQQHGIQAGLTAHCPLVLKGHCNGYPARFLVDSGATHDFVSQKFVDSQMPTQATTCISHTVQWADGRASKAEQELSGRLQLGTFFEQRSLLVSPIEGYDIVLGKPWLTTHNPLIDWRKHTIQLRVPAKQVEVAQVDVPEGHPLPDASVVLQADFVTKLEGHPTMADPRARAVVVAVDCQALPRARSVPSGTRPRLITGISRTAVQGGQSPTSKPRGRAVALSDGFHPKGLDV